MMTRDEAYRKVWEWMRKPDFAESFTVQDFVNWGNDRPASALSVLDPQRQIKCPECGAVEFLSRWEKTSDTGDTNHDR